MHKNLLNSRSKRKSARSGEKHRRYRREHTWQKPIPHIPISRVDYHCKWNESIIWARLTKAMTRINSRVSIIIKTQGINALNKKFSKIVDSTQCSAVLDSGNASNDMNYSKPSLKEELYAFA